MVERPKKKVSDPLRLWLESMSEQQTNNCQDIWDQNIKFRSETMQMLATHNEKWHVAITLGCPYTSNKWEPGLFM